MDKTFIDWWVEEIKPTTECPELYIELGAVMLVSACLGRGTSVKDGMDVIYPNLWVALVGPSGKARKTTILRPVRTSLNAIRRAYALFDAASGEYTYKFDRLCANNTSPQAFLEEFEQHPDRISVYEELSTVLEQKSVDWQKAFMPMAQELYDCPPELIRNRTLKAGTRGAPKGGRVYTDKPSYCLLGGITEGLIFRKSTADDLTGGFWPRFIPAVFCPEIKRKDMRVRGEGKPDFYTKVVEQMRPVVDWSMDVRSKWLSDQMETENGRYLVTEEIREQVAGALDHMKDRFRGEHMQGFLARASSQIYKLAQIYAFMSRGSIPPMVLTEDEISRAVRLLNLCFAGADDVFETCMVDTREGKEIEAVYRSIARSGGWMRQSDIQRACHIDSFKLAKIAKTLKDMERIVYEKRKNPRGPDTWWYRKARIHEYPTQHPPPAAGCGEGEPEQPCFGPQIPAGDVGGWSV